MISAVKSLFRDSVAYGLANIVQKLTPIVVIPIIIKYLGDNALKLYDLSFIYVYIFSALIIIGMDSAASVFYFDQKKEKFDKGQVLSYALFIQVISVTGYVVLFYPFRHDLAQIIFPHNPDMSRYWAIALGIIPGYMLYNYGLSILLWRRQKRAYVFLCVLQSALNIGGVYTAVVLLKGTTEQLFYVLVGSMTVCGIMAIGLVRQQVFHNPFPVNGALVRKLLVFGIPFALTSFFRQIIPSIDRYFLLTFHQDRYLPQYILAVKLASFINIGFLAFLLAFTPYSLNKINHEDAEAEISGIFRLVSIGALTLIPTLLLFKNGILEFFADGSYNLSAELLPLLLFGWAFDLFTNFALLGVYRAQNSLFVLGLLLTGTAIISLLDVLLVPLWGVYGAAIGFLLTKLATFFIAFFVLRKHFRIDINIFRFLALFLLTAFCSYAFFVLPFYIYLVLLILLISLAGWYVYRILQRQQLKNIFLIND